MLLNDKRCMKEKTYKKRVINIFQSRVRKLSVDQQNQKTNLWKWIFTGILLLLFSYSTVQNAIRYRVTELKRSFTLAKQYQKSADKGASLDFTRCGLRFSDYDDLTLSLPSDKLDSFSIQYEVEFDRLKAVYFRFNNEHFPIDFLLDAETDGILQKGATHLLLFEKYSDRIDFLVNGQKIETQSPGGENFSQLSLVDLDSVFFIKTLKISGSGGRVLFHFDFVPKIIPEGFGFIPVLLLTLCWAMITLFDLRFGNDENSNPIISAGRTLFFFTPLWGGTLFPLSVSTGSAFFFFGLVSFVSLIGYWTIGLSSSINKRLVYAISILAIIGLIISLRENELPAIQGLIAVWAVSVVLITAKHVAIEEKKNIYRGLEKLSVALLPAAAWLFALLPPWLDRCGAIASALVFASACMLAATVFSQRAKIRYYTLIMIFLLFTAAGASELFFRASALRPVVDMPVMRTSVHGDKFLEILRNSPENFEAEMRKTPSEKLFRNGAVPVKPNPETTRIMVLGGSSTFGYGIDQNRNTFSGVMETCINDADNGQKVEVINAGRGGYNLFMLLRTFESSGIKYGPDILVLYINSIDAHEVRGPLSFHEIWNMNSQSRKRLVDEMKKNEEKITETATDRRSPSTLVVNLQRTLRKAGLYNLLVRKISSFRSREAVRPLSEKLGALKDVNPIHDYRLNLRQLIGLCEKNRIELILVNEFDPSTIAKVSPKRRMLEQAMEGEARKAGINYYNQQEKLGRIEKPEDLFFQKPPFLRHPNRKGHEVIGNDLCEYLLNNGHL